MLIKEIKKIRRKKIRSCIFHTIVCTLILLLNLIVFITDITDKANPYDFGYAYEHNLATHSIYAYIDTLMVPDEICYYSDGRAYYYVKDFTGRGYIIYCDPDEIYNIKKQISSNGSARITGSTNKYNFDIAGSVNHYSKYVLGNEELSSSEYFKGVYLDVNGDSIAYAIPILTVPILMLGLLLLFFAYANLRHCNNTIKKFSDVEIDKIQGELNSPATIYYKRINVYITQNYLISYGAVIEIIKIEDILMAYRFIRKRNFSVLYTCLKIWTKGQKCGLVVGKQAGNPSEVVKMFTEVLNTIQQKNPQATIEYNATKKREIIDNKIAS